MGNLRAASVAMQVHLEQLPHAMGWGSPSQSTDLAAWAAWRPETFALQVQHAMGWGRTIPSTGRAAWAAWRPGTQGRSTGRRPAAAVATSGHQCGKALQSLGGAGKQRQSLLGMGSAGQHTTHPALQEAACVVCEGKRHNI
eukprot:scaffold155437_cov18-Tisochrysis_lutea.AAC.1